MTETNGQQAPQPPHSAPDGGANQQIVSQLTPHIRIAMNTTMRGLMTGFPGIPEHVLLQMMAFECGFFSGSALAGDLGTIFKIRGMFKKAFEDGIKKAPLTQPGMPAPPQGGQ